MYNFAQVYMDMLSGILKIPIRNNEIFHYE